MRCPRLGGGAAVGVLLALAAAPRTFADPPEAWPHAPSFEAAHCQLCHDVPGVAPAPRIASCTDCHTWIRDVAGDPERRHKAMEIFPLWERYERNVATYMVVPDLPAAMARLEPDWVRAYLKDPHDLRPHLPETMPRFGLDDAGIDAIVAGFAAMRVEVDASPAPDPANLERGAALFVDRGCVGCHTLGAVHTGPGLPHAPDLAHTRDRMSADVVYAWILDPQAIAPTATMSSTRMSEDQVRAVRDYVLLVDPGWTVAPALPEPPAPATEPVAWAEVEERVFGKICVHCHMNPENNQGRAGPGNAGGFGWPATGIELETYEGVVAVSERIPDALLRRRLEAHRDAVAPGQRPAVLTRPDKPGMPLGLPPLPDEDIALVLGWIEQGTPR